jgi:hypothetical protein
MIEQEQTEATKQEKPLWIGMLKAALLGLMIGAVLASLAYISTQQPKVWFDRQWAGLALYRGGYRSWTLSFCDGFTIAPGTYTNGLAKMVPVTLDLKTMKMRYGYHWPTFSHSDLRPFLKANNLGDGWPPQDIRTTSNVFLTVPDVTALNWGSNIVLTVTNTGTMQIDFPPDISRGDNP